MKKPTKKKTVAQLKKDAWKVFSLWIRTRDSFRCITCGKRGDASMRGMHAGHYISRRHNATLFDERNVNAQCMYCNMYDYGNIGVYTLKLQEKYGDGIIKELTEKSKTYHQFSVPELEKFIAELKEKLADLST